MTDAARKHATGLRDAKPGLVMCVSCPAGEPALSSGLAAAFGVSFFAAGRTHELRLAQETSALQLAAWAVFAAEKARHRRRAKRAGCGKGRTRSLAAITQAVGIDGSLGIGFGHGCARGGR